jgi:CRP/FNR family transcriptional regulator
MQHAVIQILREAEFFKGFPPEAIRRLAERAVLKALRKRQVLFAEGARGDAMYVLAEGSVQLHKTGREGNDVVIRTIRPGETFAEVVLFEQDRYPVTATAAVRSRVLLFLRADIRALLDTGAFRDAFIAMLMRKQRYLAERVRYLTDYDVETRFLLFLREHGGADAARFQVDLSKQDVARAIGTTPETLSRLLNRLRRERLVRWDRRAVRVSPSAWRLVG